MKYPSDSEISESLRKLFSELKKPKSYILEMANNIFINKHITLKAKFEDQMRKIFQSGVKKIDVTNRKKAVR